MDNKGVSLVLINTKKGKIIFDKIIKDINYLECKVKQCLQPRLQCSSSFSPIRECFWKDYTKHGFLYIGKKYGDLGLINQIKRNFLKIKNSIKKVINPNFLR
jgi:hypothetical protein